MDGAFDASNSDVDDTQNQMPDNDDMASSQENDMADNTIGMADENPSMDNNNGDDAFNGNDIPNEDETDDDSTSAIINQLSPTDKEAVRAYAESLLDRSEKDNGEDMDTSANDNPNQNEEPLMEVVNIKKGELERIFENFGPTQDEILNSIEDSKPLKKKVKMNTKPNSPFNAPKFQ